jgi:hypothetical protein
MYKFSAEDLKSTSGIPSWKPTAVDSKDVQKSAAGFTAIVVTHGVRDWNIGVAGVVKGSAVVVSLCEVTADTHTPFLGNANMSVANVETHDGGIIVRTNVAWGSDLVVRFNIVVS